MKKFIKDCENCEGWGYNLYNDDFEQNPIFDRRTECTLCEEGKVLDFELINEAIEDVQYMIDGMITRIRLTSDNIKMVAKFEMLPDFMARYKNRLHTQARALARLEMYKSNLENL